MFLNKLFPLLFLLCTLSVRSLLAAQEPLCPNTPLSFLSVGIQGQVSDLDGDVVRLRSGPGTGNSILLEMEAATEFDVIGGPECKRYAWWQLQLADGTVGWAAEGTEDTYFLEPSVPNLENAPLPDGDDELAPK